MKLRLNPPWRNPPDNPTDPPPHGTITKMFGVTTWYDAERGQFRRVGRCGGRGKASQIKKKLRQRALRAAKGLRMDEVVKKVQDRMNAIEW